MTPEENKAYARIIKESAMAAMAGLDSVRSNRSGSSWMQDNGFFVTYLDIESVKAWGVRIRVAIQFFWSQYDFCCYQFCDGLSHIYPSVTDEIHLPEVPMNEAALLEYEAHSLADFERYFARLMNAAREKFDYYGRMRDLTQLQKALASRKNSDCADDGKNRYDLDLALVAMTAGDRETAVAIMRDAVDHSRSPEIVEEAKEMLAHIENREDWLFYVNSRISSGRKLLSPKLKFVENRNFAFV